jgi:membrane-bound metal-dependent hydrolase YbcI (DUF457 family)
MEPTQVMLACTAAGIGSLAPDIDHPRSTISFGIPSKLINGALWRLFLLAMVGSIVAFASRRTLSDTLWEWYSTPIIHGVVDFLVIAILVGVALTTTSLVITTLFSHRGATHSLIFMAGATGLAITAIIFFGGPWWYGFFFGWGWLTHLLADATTEMGLPNLLWPFV